MTPMVRFVIQLMSPRCQTSRSARFNSKPAEPRRWQQIDNLSANFRSLGFEACGLSSIRDQRSLFDPR